METCMALLARPVKGGLYQTETLPAIQTETGPRADARIGLRACFTCAFVYLTKAAWEAHYPPGSPVGRATWNACAAYF